MIAADITPGVIPPLSTVGTAGTSGTASIYTRRRSGEDGETEQIAAAEAYFAQHLAPRGYVLGGCFADQAVAGKVPFLSRPSAYRLSVAVQAGDAIIIAASSAAFAGTRDLARSLDVLSRRGVVVHLLDIPVSTNSVEGRALLDWLPALKGIHSRWWSEQRRQTVARQRREGRPVGALRYGFRLTGPKGKRRWSPCPHTRAIGQKIVAMRAAGWTWHAIYFHLLKCGVRARDGREMSVGAIQRHFNGELQLQAEEAAAPRDCGTR